MRIPGQRISRALFSSSDYSKQKGVVKPRAFLPVIDQETGTLETSAADTDGLPEAHVWTHLNAYVAVTRPDGSMMHGRADVSDADVLAAQLQTRFDGGEARHVAIVDWPADKERQKALALELASAADLLLLE